MLHTQLSVDTIYSTISSPSTLTLQLTITNYSDHKESILSILECGPNMFVLHVYMHLQTESAQKYCPYQLVTVKESMLAGMDQDTAMIWLTEIMLLLWSYWTGPHWSQLKTITMTVVPVITSRNQECLVSLSACLFSLLAWCAFPGSWMQWIRQ